MMPTFTRAESPSRITDTCQRCGHVITHLKGDPAHRTALQGHRCVVKEGRK